MPILDIARQALLFAHLMVFAIAIAEVLRADWKLLKSDRIDWLHLDATTRSVKWLLIALWATGVALACLRPQSELLTLLSDPKFQAKLVVVTALTVNGVLLHFMAFPSLRKGEGAVSPAVVTILGAVSTTSWLFAGFVGASRIIAPHMSFSLFIGLYEIALVAAVGIGLAFVQQHVRRLMRGNKTPGIEEPPEVPTTEESLHLLRQIETATQALRDAQNQLQSVRHRVMQGPDNNFSACETGTPKRTDTTERDSTEAAPLHVAAG